MKSGRPLPEMLREAVRIHAPYTHVPYHERIDDGYVNFVNNDHCLLSARAALHLSKMVPSAAAGLPLAQTIWYIPTGLDIWNQKIGKAPGHYSRGLKAGGPAAGAGRALARPGAAGARRPAEGAARPVDDAGASRPGGRRLSRVPRPDGQSGGAPRGAGRTRLRRPDRRAGPLVPEPLLHHRPQVVPRPRDGRAGRRDRLGRSRTTCSMPARSTSPSARAGTRSTRSPATPSWSISTARRCTPCPMAARPSSSARSSPTTRRR